MTRLWGLGLVPGPALARELGGPTAHQVRTAPPRGCRRRGTATQRHTAENRRLFAGDASSPQPCSPQLEATIGPRRGTPHGCSGDAFGGLVLAGAFIARTSDGRARAGARPGPVGAEPCIFFARARARGGSFRSSGGRRRACDLEDRAARQQAEASESRPGRGHGEGDGDDRRWARERSFGSPLSSSRGRSKQASASRPGLSAEDGRARDVEAVLSPADVPALLPRLSPGEGGLLGRGRFPARAMVRGTLPAEG